MTICQELHLRITHDGKYVRVHLEDPLSMCEAEVSMEIGVTTISSRTYHLREATLIGLRQVLEQAFELGMMRVDATELPVPVPTAENQGGRVYHIFKDLDKVDEDDLSVIPEDDEII